MPVNSMTMRRRAIGAVSGAFLAIVLAGCSGNVSPMRSLTGQDIFLTPDTASIRGTVSAGATLDSMLRDHGLAAGAVNAAVAAAAGVFDARRLRAPQPFVLERTLDGQLRHFEYEIDPDFFLRVEPVATGSADLRAQVVPIPKRLEHAVVAGAIDEATPSLFQAMDATGETAELTLGLAAIFAGEIDFNNEVQPGDRFTLAFGRFVRDSRPSTYGEITAAEFENEGRLIRAVRFAPAGGRPDYFDEQGRSLRRFFLRSPLKFEPRVTSRFSTSRFHPVLRVARPHRGVDYGAPSGAPVVSVSSGTVVSATFDNANGRMVRLRHASGYESYYLHLSTFAPGIRRGARVDQGQMVGRVGATGLATGPHLHYGLQKNGAWVDPLREHRNMPPGDPVPASDMDEFRAVRDEALRQLEKANL
jgi:murein DD-endopeptidase MepM/ murein hydrolase activator NlpD